MVRCRFSSTRGTTTINTLYLSYLVALAARKKRDIHWGFRPQNIGTVIQQR